MRKLLFMCINMNIGGTEKALLTMLNQIDTSKYNITLLMLEEYGGFLNQVPDFVKIRYVNEYKKIKPFLKEAPQLLVKKLIKDKEYLKGFSTLFYYSISKITNNMSYVIKNTTDSMRERDLQLSKTMNNNSVTSSNNNVQGESDNGRLSIFDVDPDFNLFEDLKDGDLAVDIGVEGSIISWDKDANFGNSTIGGSAGIDLDGGNVVAKGEVSADIKNGDFGASGQLGAYVGKGEISGSFNFGPIEISGSVGGLVGIGAGGNIGFEDGKFGIGGNITCGPGVDFGVSIGINDEWFKELFK